jgi:hypothetical protein
MAGSDTDELSPAEIEARMGAGLKRALATPPVKAKPGEKKRRPAQPDQQPA